MYRLLYHLLRAISVWPILALLILFVVFLQWFMQDNDKQAALDQLLGDVFQVQQDCKKAESTFDSLAFIDLRRRALLYTDEFLPLADQMQPSISAAVNPALARSGWTVQRLELEESQDASARSSLGSVFAAIDASMPVARAKAINETVQQKTSPLITALDACQQLWLVPPLKEITGLSIERIDERYALKVRIFLPVRAQGYSSEFAAGDRL